jgi:hypothetical protein
LARLEPLKNLEVLDLRLTDITDAAVPHLSALPKLRSLWLSEHVTNACLAGLGRLTGLEDLWIEESDITSEGCERLARALPGTKISWNAEPTHTVTKRPD